MTSPLRFLSRSLRLMLAVLTLSLLWAVPAVFAAAYTVNSTNDADDGTCDGTHCSLREAINTTNTSAGVADTISFSVSGTISPSTILPKLTDSAGVSIDGAGNIDIDGANSLTYGLRIDTGSASNTIKGLAFKRFTTDAILAGGTNSTIGGTGATDKNILTTGGAGSSLIEVTGSGHTIIGNYIGVRSDGSTADGASNGILISSGAGALTIGGDTSAERNVISGNSTCGINIAAAPTGTLTVTGNYIGTSSTGGAAAANGTGICSASATYASAITIGTTTSGESNLISGNTTDGINLVGTFNANTDISGNIIGLNKNSNGAIANASDGVELNGASCSASVTCRLASNTIGGNTGNGVNIKSSSSRFSLVKNKIGNDGTTAYANNIGVTIDSSNNITVGQTDGTYDNPNVISGNTSHGIYVTGSTASSITITEDIIGLNGALDGAIANGGDGVNINGSGTVTFGISSSTASLNYIGGNTGDGIDITSNAGAIGIYSSSVGVVNATDLGNGEDGIQISGSPTAVVTIGNSRSADGGTGGNVVSGNAAYGINIGAGNSHVIKGNHIGTDKNATSAVANDSGGINVSGGSSTTIGGTASYEGNVIAGHGGAGDYDVTIGASASGVTVYGNYIGMNSAGTTIASANGILVQGSTTTIGSSTGSGRNYLGGHTGTASLHINGASTATVIATSIGLKPDSTASTTTTGILINSNGATAPSNISISSTGSSSDHVLVSNGSAWGIDVQTGSSIVLKGIIIGTNPLQNTDMGNTSGGIRINGGSTINVGRTADSSAYAGVVVVGNGGHGISIPSGSTADGVYIAQVQVGVTGASYAAMANDQDGINIAGGSNIFIGGTGANDSSHIGSNTGDGIEINAETGVTIRRNFIGVTTTGLARGNGGAGVSIKNGSTSNVVGNSFSDTVSLNTTTGYANRLGYNTGGDVVIDGATSTGNSIRGNVFDLAAADTSTNISLTNSANNSVSLSGTSLTTKNTSRVAGTTNFAANTKVDVYSITSAYATTYEGTAAVSGTSFQLDQDFTATSSDQYFYNIVESDGDSTALSSKVTVDADSTAPSVPTITSTTTLTNTAAYTLTGTKEAYSSILNNASTTLVAVDSSTTWSYSATLTEGSNAYVLTSKDYSNNASAAASTFTVTLDTAAPAAPTLTSSNDITSSATTYATTLTGTKDANTNVRNNGTQIVASDSSTTWSYGVTLAQGSNAFLLTSADLAGNISNSTEFSIRLNQPSAGGGGGSGGSGGSSGSSGSTGGTSGGANSSTGGESESKDSGNGAVSGEEEKPSGISSGGESESKPAETVQPASAPIVIKETPKPVVVQPAPVIVEEIKDLYPAEKEKVEEATNEEKPEATLVSYDIATYVEIPVVVVDEKPVEVLVTRTAILSNTDYQKITPVDDAGVPVWIQEKFSAEKNEENVIQKDSDLDNDGILDVAEILLGTKLDRKDSDGDGINDDKEIAQGTNPTQWDTDGDGVSDRDEARRGTNPNDTDSDNDGVSDAEEISAGSDPKNGKDKPRVDEQGVPEEWASKYRDLKEVKYGEAKKIEGIQKEIKLTFAMTDTDGDGLTDQNEYKFGTNPTRGDTDRDGVLDGAEVHDYQTDPTRDTKTDSFYSAKSSNLKPTGNTFTGAPMMRGTSQPNSTVELIFLPKDKASPTAWNLFASLFGVDTNGAITEKVQTDATGKFLARPEVKDGEYTVVVRSLNAEGGITEESLPYEVKVDRSLEEKVVTPRQLDTEAIDVANLQLITIANSRPYLYGTAKKGYEVVTSWKSQLYTSSLLVDTDEGEFVTLAPADLESGDHDLYVYAVEPVKNVSTSSISIDFNVLGAALYGAAESVAPDGGASVLANWKLWAGLGVPLLIVVALMARRKKSSLPSVSQ